jgi:hypothetical protein
MERYRSMSAAAAAVCAFAVAGCQTMQPNRPLTILVRDAETQAPIANARIHLHAMEGHLPGADMGNAGDDGIAHLAAPGNDTRALGIEAEAKGYMEANTFISSESLKAIEPSPRFGKDKPRPVAVTVDLYAGPRPSVELVIPAGYHGVLKTDRAIEHDLACPPGQRRFTFPVAADGSVRVTGPGMLERVDVADYRFRYEDNAPISSKADHTPLGYWWLRHEGNVDYFVVGDKGDYMLARSDMPDTGDAPPRSSGGGGHKGGGGGHHRGGGGGGMGGGGGGTGGGAGSSQ